MDNLIGLLFVYLAKIYAFIHKVVTRTELLAQVSLLLVTNFKWNQPILGYMLSVHVGYNLLTSGNMKILSSSSNMINLNNNPHKDIEADSTEFCI